MRTEFDSYVFFFTENTQCATKNGGCALFCLPIPTGRTCGCEDYDTLKSDGKSCTGRKFIHVLTYLERQQNIMHYAEFTKFMVLGPFVLIHVHPIIAELPRVFDFSK